jgi:hypothetical protein
LLGLKRRRRRRRRGVCAAGRQAGRRAVEKRQINLRNGEENVVLRLFGVSTSFMGNICGRDRIFSDIIIDDFFGL